MSGSALGGAGRQGDDRGMEMTTARRRRTHARALDRRALASLMLGLLVLLGGLLLALSRSDERRSGTDGVWVQAQAVLERGVLACQGRELLPAQTSVVRISAVTRRPPMLVVRDGGRGGAGV
jgi:hypothetical protein